MQSLVSENIYEEVNITDYQGVCNAKTSEGNPANVLQTVSNPRGIYSKTANLQRQQRPISSSFSFLHS